MSNTVGSLSHFQKSVIIGSILGDGHLRRIVGRKDAFLEINHSIKAREYVNWKYQILKDICLSEPKERKIDCKRTAIRFFTRQHPIITQLYKEFYREGRKIVPPGFKLDQISLAVWFMDDGSKTKKRDLYLNSQQFDLKSQKRLLHALRLMGIRARLNKDKKYYRIRIYKESIPKFINLIKPYLHPCLLYKINGLSPVETYQEKPDRAS